MTMQLNRILGAAVVASAVFAAAVSAQDAPATPFHQGQWGAHIQMNGLTFGGVDLLKFTSSTRAWVVNVSGNGRLSRVTGSSGYDDNSLEQIALSLQRRFFHPLGTHAAIYISPGILGQFAHGCNALSPSGPNFCARSWQAGVMAEAGGEYVFTPHLGVGARYRASLTYQRQDISSLRFWSVNASAASAGVFAAIFF